MSRRQRRARHVAPSGRFDADNVMTARGARAGVRRSGSGDPSGSPAAVDTAAAPRPGAAAGPTPLLPSPLLPPSVLLLPAAAAAHALIGAVLTVDGVGGLITETEAYDRHDPASHSHRGPTPRNAAMFGPPGHAYVYRSYGIHWCLNLVCGPEPGAAVLIRALQPLHGLDAMRARRGAMPDRLLCAGPGRLCAALGVTAALDGRALDAPPFRLLAPAGPAAVVAGPRIGISRAQAVPWRFGLHGSRHLSRPFPPGAARV